MQYIAGMIDVIDHLQRHFVHIICLCILTLILKNRVGGQNISHTLDCMAWPVT